MTVKHPRTTAVLLLLSLAFPLHSFAQDMQPMPMAPGAEMPPQQPQQIYSQQQLEQMLAPIALYPDQLVSQILMASTYPLEVVEAYRWMQETGSAQMQTSELADALQQEPWDPSVKSLVAFPQVMKQLDDNLQWTEQLGDAFLAQQGPVMNTIQALRQQARAAGNLHSTPQQTVTMQSNDILIMPASPQVVYVPVYNPTIVYGRWPYPTYPPYYFPGYATAGVVIGFGVGIFVVDELWGWNHWDWEHHRIIIDDHRFSWLNRGHAPESGGVWHHEADHRRGVPYRDNATREHFQANTTPEMRRNYRGYGAQAHAGFTPAVHTQNDTVHRENVVNRPAEQHQAPAEQHQNVEHPTSQHEQRNAQRNATFQQNAQQHTAPAMQQRSSAPVFESFSRGADVRNQSSRGAASRQDAPEQRDFNRGSSDNNIDRHGGENDRHR